MPTEERERDSKKVKPKKEKDKNHIKTVKVQTKHFENILNKNLGDEKKKKSKTGKISNKDNSIDGLASAFDKLKIGGKEKQETLVEEMEIDQLQAYKKNRRGNRGNHAPNSVKNGHYKSLQENSKNTLAKRSVIVKTPSKSSSKALSSGGEGSDSDSEDYQVSPKGRGLKSCRPKSCSKANKNDNDSSNVDDDEDEDEDEDEEEDEDEDECEDEDEDEDEDNDDDDEEEEEHDECDDDADDCDTEEGEEEEEYEDEGVEEYDDEDEKSGSSSEHSTENYNRNNGKSKPKSELSLIKREKIHESDKHKIVSLKARNNKVKESEKPIPEIETNDKKKLNKNQTGISAQNKNYHQKKSLSDKKSRHVNTQNQNKHLRNKARNDGSHSEVSSESENDNAIEQEKTRQNIGRKSHKCNKNEKEGNDSDHVDMDKKKKLKKLEKKRNEKLEVEKSKELRYEKESKSNRRSERSRERSVTHLSSKSPPPLKRNHKDSKSIKTMHELGGKNIKEKKNRKKIIIIETDEEIDLSALSDYEQVPYTQIKTKKPKKLLEKYTSKEKKSSKKEMKETPCETKRSEPTKDSKKTEKLLISYKKDASTSGKNKNHSKAKKLRNSDDDDDDDFYSCHENDDGDDNRCTSGKKMVKTGKNKSSVEKTQRERSSNSPRKTSLEEMHKKTNQKNSVKIKKDAKEKLQDLEISYAGKLTSTERSQVRSHEYDQIVMSQKKDDKLWMDKNEKSRTRKLAERNILLLGQSGVGKSTWINSIFNYLRYPSLSDAEMYELDYIIPSSFTMSFSTADGYKSEVVKIGNDENEVSIPGRSATRDPKTYKFQCEDKIIRLIDTPGLGDTEGIDRDKQNMKKIIDHLSTLTEIHGICILLKSNQTRISPVYEFCIRELLANLHRSAAKNIIFCFTNARASQYLPGETICILQELLEKTGLGDTIPLNSENTFCLDNEAFRYLCTLRCQNIPKYSQDTQTYGKSWNKSVAETKRLFKRLDELEPHRIADTVHLRVVRDRLLCLMEPVAEITRLIQLNVAAILDQQHLIETSTEDLAILKQKLYVPKIITVTVPLDKPQTVCKSKKCAKAIFLEDLNAWHETYPQICHMGCQLSGITPETYPNEGLKSCAAMQKYSGERCGECECPWYEHKHTTYRLEFAKRKIKDKNIEQAMEYKQNAQFDIEKLYRQLEERTTEYMDEQSTILMTLVRFKAFMKQNSIGPYCDIFELYLRDLIQREGNKINKTQVDEYFYVALSDTLMAYKNEQEKFNGLSFREKDNLTLEYIDHLEKNLFSLPLTGKQIQKHMKVVLSSKPIWRENSEQHVNIKPIVPRAEATGQTALVPITYKSTSF